LKTTQKVGFVGQGKSRLAYLRKNVDWMSLRGMNGSEILQ